MTSIRDTRVLLLIVILVTFVLAFIVGFLIGWFGKPTSDNEKLLDRLVADEDPSIKDRILAEIDAENIREYLR